MKNKKYNIIATIKPWNIEFFNKNKNLAMYLVVNIYIACSAVIFISLTQIPINILGSEIPENVFFGGLIVGPFILYYIYCYTRFLALNPIYAFFKISSSLILIIMLKIIFFSKLQNVLSDADSNWVLKPFAFILLIIIILMP